MSESFWWGKDVGRVGMGMVTISFETGGREGFEPINDSRPSLCATTERTTGSGLQQRSLGQTRCYRAGSFHFISLPFTQLDI